MTWDTVLLTNVQDLLKLKKNKTKNQELELCIILATFKSENMGITLKIFSFKIQLLF